MKEVSASKLLSAFKSNVEVGIMARNAVLSGANFDIGLNPLPAPMILGNLRGRLRHTQRRGKQIIGAAECIAALAAMGERDLLVGYVDDREGAGYFFQLYLDPHPLSVIGCIRVGISPGDDHVSDPAPRG